MIRITRLFFLLLLGTAACSETSTRDTTVIPPPDNIDEGSSPHACTTTSDCPFGHRCRNSICVPDATTFQSPGCASNNDCTAPLVCAIAIGECINPSETPNPSLSSDTSCTPGETRTCGSKIGACNYGEMHCDDGGQWTTCLGGIGPIPEMCNGIDDDCDGTILPSELDADGDGFRNCNGDCDDANTARFPGAIDLCDGQDNNCDGYIDEQGNRLCNDDLYCNGEETCSAGTCLSGISPNCNDLDSACTIGSCDEDNDSCLSTNRPDATNCSDGLFCTQGDTCNAGVCQGITRDCSSSSDACNTGTCDETQDQCVASPKPNETSCDDGMFCTDIDRCQSGVCTGHERSCDALNDSCNRGTCDENANSCVATPVSDGTGCNDALFCTLEDHCVAGLCLGNTPRDCSSVSDQCNSGGCDETADRCVAHPVANTTPCNDNLFCTVGEQCQSGSCTAGLPRDCSASGGSCRTGTCDESADQCTGSPQPDGTSCDDTRFCTVQDHCQAGSCIGSSRDCSASGNDCNDGTCSDTLQSCIATAKLDGTLCDDGRFCTVTDMCSAGSCAGLARDCSAASDTCNTGVCNETGSRCEPSSSHEGQSCNDGRNCTITDHCSSGACRGETNPCNSMDTSCLDGFCDVGTDQCTARPLSNGISCDDGKFCTIGDACNNGTCGGSPNPCSNTPGGGACTTPICDTSADHCTNQTLPNGTSCTDSQFCTVGDHCINGSCNGSPRDCSILTSACTTGSCSNVSQACISSPLSSTTTCSDNNLCTQNDHCLDGGCHSGTPVDCSHLTDRCHVGQCDPTGACLRVNSGACDCDDQINADFDGYNQCDDCDDTNGAIFPGATERCNSKDDNCNGQIDEGFDVDHDGYFQCSLDDGLVDCNDNNASVHPGALENCNTPDDDNCNGVVNEGCIHCDPIDHDHDGFSECTGDCSDNDNAVYPGAYELCDGKDNDCNKNTIKNCDVSERCDWPTEEVDICKDQLMCACILENGVCKKRVCTVTCNTSRTGALEDGCDYDESCYYDVYGTSNLHACAQINTLGLLPSGSTCTGDSDCRSGQCRFVSGRTSSSYVCTDYCTEDRYCDVGTRCVILDTGSNIDGRCLPTWALQVGTGVTGQRCTSHPACAHGFCFDASSDYCTEACCDDDECPSGMHCALNTVTRRHILAPAGTPTCTSDRECRDLYADDGMSCVLNSDGIYRCGRSMLESAPMCLFDVSSQASRPAGAACAQNRDCQSNFCSGNLGVCVSPCCTDYSCPEGLACEMQLINAGQGLVDARVCVSQSTDEVIQRL